MQERINCRKYIGGEAYVLPEARVVGVVTLPAQKAAAAARPVRRIDS